jgi:histidinol-phosphate aminotransferase
VNNPRNEALAAARSAADYVAAVVRPEVRALTAYHVADPGHLVKLDANESPFPLPAALRAGIAAAVADVAFHRYPDGGARAVAAALARALTRREGLGLILGNGSDELIQIVALALARPGAVVLAPEPTFVMYRVSALLAGMRFVGVPLAADFGLDIHAMEAAIARERPALVFLASPNNPTGNLFAAAHIERILRAAPGLVVVDEAYGPYTYESFLTRIREFPNLVVLRTVSKIGLAALRLGYAVGAPEWIAELDKVRQPYNVNALTQAAAQVVLGEEALLAQHAATIQAERRRVGAALAKLPGVTVFASEANFVLVRVPDAADWHRRLRAAGILVKSFHGAHAALANCLRITIGTPTENDALIEAMGAIR